MQAGCRWLSVCPLKVVAGPAAPPDFQELHGSKHVGEARSSDTLQRDGKPHNRKGRPATCNLDESQGDTSGVRNGQEGKLQCTRMFYACRTQANLQAD